MLSKVENSYEKKDLDSLKHKISNLSKKQKIKNTEILKNAFANDDKYLFNESKIKINKTVVEESNTGLEEKISVDESSGENPPIFGTIHD